eukprot:9477987-Pyramimonas_sp.AAC.2
MEEAGDGEKEEEGGGGNEEEEDDDDERGGGTTRRREKEDRPCSFACPPHPASGIQPGEGPPHPAAPDASRARARDSQSASSEHWS